MVYVYKISSDYDVVYAEIDYSYFYRKPEPGAYGFDVSSTLEAVQVDILFQTIYVVLLDELGYVHMYAIIFPFNMHST